MAVDIDRLQIQIKADATSADRAVSNLADKIDKLSGSLGRLPVGTLDRLATSVSHLGTAMQTMRNIDARVFSGLATKINSLANIDNARLTQAANAIRHIGITLSNLGNVSQGAVQISEVAKNIAKLGGKNVTNAIANLPLLTRELNNMLTTLSRSPQVSRNIIDMTNALANLASQGRNISTVTNGMVNGLNRQSRAMNTARRSSFNLASAFGMLYAKYFLVMRAIKAFGRAITSTSDYIEAYNYYNVAFGKIAEEWKGQYAEYGYANAEAYADSFTQRMNESLSKMSGLQVSVGADGTGLLTTTGMRNLGLNIQEVTQYASQLASVTNSVGQTGEVSLIAAESFTKLGADISSLFNMDYSSVMQNLQSGLIGQSRALYKFGIDITAATLQTYAYELGLSKAVSEMTQAEKMQLRMIAILDQSKVSWGDLANTINSPSNMLRQFKNNLSEVGNVLGQLFIPIMQKAMPVINGLTIALKDFLVNLALFMGIKLDLGAFGQGFADLEDETGGLSDNLDDIASSAKKATAGLRKFDELNNINISDNNGGGASALGSSIDLTKEISTAAEEYRKAWDEAYAKMENRAQEFADSIKAIFAPITEPLTRMFQNLSLGGYTQAGEYAGETISAIFNSAASALESVDWKEVGNNIGLFLKGIDWKEIFSSVGNFFITLVESAIELWGETFDAAPFETSLISAIALLKFTGLGSLIVGKIVTSITNQLTGGKAITALVAGFKALFGSSAAKSALAFMGKVTKFFTGLGAVIAGAVLAVSSFVDMWTDGFSWAREVVMLLGIGITAVGAIILGAPAAVAGVVAGIVAAVGTLAVVIHDNWDSIKEWTSNLVESIGGFFKNLFSGLKEWWNDFTGWLSDGIESLGKTIDNLFGEKGAFMGGAASVTINHGKRAIPAQTYAAGGFPEDGLFYANHTELVGQFSNGQTAVANNQQITQGIADAVYPAVYNAVVSAMANNGGNTIKIEGDPHGMFKAFVEEWNNESRRTQKNPVPIYSR